MEQSPPIDMQRDIMENDLKERKMKIVVNDDKKISTIQQEFSDLFPYLKLVFFEKAPKIGGLSAKIIAKYLDKTIEQYSTIRHTETLTITPQMTVADLKHGFNDIFGIHIQVFRESGKAWLDATITEGWTLDEQNRQGKALSEKEVKKS